MREGGGKDPMLTGSNCRANKTRKQHKAGEDQQTEQRQQPTTKAKQKATACRAATAGPQKPPDGHETSDGERQKRAEMKTEMELDLNKRPTDP